MWPMHVKIMSVCRVQKYIDSVRVFKYAINLMIPWQVLSSFVAPVLL